MARQVEVTWNGFPDELAFNRLLRNGLPFDQDVYDAASGVLSAVSEWSIANRSNSIDVPDFTDGAGNQQAVDLLLEQEGIQSHKSGQ